MEAALAMVPVVEVAAMDPVVVVEVKEALVGGGYGGSGPSGGKS